MVTWIDSIHEKASAIQAQISTAESLSTELPDGLGPYIGSLKEMLNKLYLEELPLARILDQSDLVCHAVGPAARDENPWLSSFSWLCNIADKQLRDLATSVSDLSTSNAKALRKKLDLRFSGLAHGSLYAGFRIEGGERILTSTDDEYSSVQIKKMTRDLPAISAYIQSEHISEEINDYVTDPAMRDAALSTIFHISPTGRKGISEIFISSPGVKSVSLSMTKRNVIRESFRLPNKNAKKHGTFVGEVRHCDLDTNRFHIRGDSFGTIRCLLRDLSKNQARSIIGHQVRVSGSYEISKEGRPRLLYVENIERIAPPDQLSI